MCQRNPADPLFAGSDPQASPMRTLPRWLPARARDTGSPKVDPQANQSGGADASFLSTTRGFIIVTHSASTPTNRFSFTKIITKNLDGLASFYKSVFGMHELQRVRSSVNAEPIEEIILTISGDMASEPVLVLFNFIERPSLKESDSILGFLVGDLDKILARVQKAGGKVMADPKIHDEGRARVRVAFAADPEGRLLEIVQMTF